VNVRRLAGVTRILPVNVPTRFHLEIKPYLGAFASIEQGVRKEQLHVQVGNVGGIRCGECVWDRRKRGNEREN
jgi:hypothetical protein